MTAPEAAIPLISRSDFNVIKMKPPIIVTNSLFVETVNRQRDLLSIFNLILYAI